MERVFKFVGVICAMALLGGCCAVFDICPPPPPPKSVDDAFLSIYEQKRLSERAVKDAKSVFKNYTGQQLKIKTNTLKSKYNKAELKGNAFIDLVQTKLKANNLADSDMKPGATEVVNSVQALLDFVDVEQGGGLQLKNLKVNTITGTPVSEAVEGAIVGLAKAGVIIWQAQKDQQGKEIAEKNQQMYNELDKRRWQQWEDLTKKQ